MATSPTTYQVTDPITAQSDTPAQAVAPTPSGQMPPQPGNTTMTPPGQYDNAAPPSTQGATQALTPQPGQPLQSARPDQTVTPSQPAQQQKAAPNPHIGAIMSTAEVLGGGPRYRTTVDPSTGAATRQQLPPDKKDIVWSILLAALSGSLAGASAKGPNAAGQAAALGLQQGQNIAAQRQQAEQQQANDAVKDAQLQQTTASNNLKLLSLAQSVGKQSEDANANSVQNAAPMIKLAKDAGAVVAENVSAADAKDPQKYGIGDYDRLPDGYHQRLDANGQPVFISAGTGHVVPEGTPGSVPAWDRTYTITNTKPVPLTDDQGKNLPWVQSAIARGDIISNGGNIASGVRIPLTIAIGIQRDQALTDAAETDINRVRQANGLDPINLDPDIKQNHSLANSLNALQGQLNANGHNYQQALKALSAQDPSAVGAIVNYYGGLPNLQKVDDQAAKTKIEQGYRNNGIPDDKTAQQILSAPKGSYSPDVIQAAKDLQANAVTQAGAKARAEEAGKLPGQLALKRAEASASGSSVDSNPAANAAPNAQGVNDTYLATLPATTRSLVTALAEGRKIMPNRSSKDGIELMKMVTTAYPDYDENKGRAYGPTLTKFDGGKEGQQVNALNTAIRHIKSGYDALNSISALGTLPVVGAAERLFGNKDAAMLSDAKKVMVDEVNNAWSSKALTEQERNSLEKQINSASPVELRNHFVDFTKLLGTKMQALQEQLDDARPSQAIQRKQLMHDSTIGAYKSITGENPDDVLLVNRNTRQSTPQQQNGQQPSVNQPQMLPGQRHGETPVVVDGKVVGFTMPGKTGMRPAGQ